jgi:hypothetical protein
MTAPPSSRATRTDPAAGGNGGSVMVPSPWRIGDACARQRP